MTPRYAKLRDTSNKVFGWENIELISDRPFETMLAELKRLKQEYPDRALIASIMEEVNRWGAGAGLLLSSGLLHGCAAVVSCGQAAGLLLHLHACGPALPLVNRWGGGAGLWAQQCTAALQGPQAGGLLLAPALPLVSQPHAHSTCISTTCIICPHPPHAAALLPSAPQGRVGGDCGAL